MDKKRFKNWPFIISIAVHIALFAFLIVNEKQRNTEAKKPAQVEWVDIQDLPSFEKTKKAQIVQQDKTINDEIPEEDYKLSQFNQDVMEETRSAKTGAFKNTTNLQKGNSKPTVANKKKALKDITLADLNPSIVDDSFDDSKIEPESKPAHTGGSISQNDDYLKDVAIGVQTLLKTREFVYYSYYNRIKSKLRQHWEPRIKKKIVRILKKGRTIASVNDKITRLIITLDQSGELVRIQVRNASGYNDLDDAAVEAFRAAAPFPNPPTGIADKTGNIEINWDFVLET